MIRNSLVQSNPVKYRLLYFRYWEQSSLSILRITPGFIVLIQQNGYPFFSRDLNNTLDGDSECLDGVQAFDLNGETGFIQLIDVQLNLDRRNIVLVPRNIDHNIGRIVALAGGPKSYKFNNLKCQKYAKKLKQA